MFCFLQLSNVSGRPRCPRASARRALVGFVDRPATRLHRLLRPGFRHCFVLLDDGSGWVLIDPLKHRIEIRRVDPPAGFDLATFYLRRGHRVLEGRVRPRQAMAGLVPEFSTCVTVVKRALGIVSPRVQTPHQLYCHLSVAYDPPFWPPAVDEGC